VTPYQDPDAIPERTNIALLLERAAAEWPDQTAVRVQASGAQVTFRELARRAESIAAGMAARGVRPGDRACLFVPPGVDLIAATYALFRMGAVPVLLDPGMGRKRLLTCIERVRPRVLIGVPRAQVARVLFPSSFKSVALSITSGPRIPFGGPTLAQLANGKHKELELADTAADDEAAILFTSGSTGPPKGVVYTHGMFQAQVRALADLYHFEPGEVDLCCFPLFALFDVAFGMTTVFPDMDVTRPASCDPKRIFEAVREYGATTTFGSPAIWSRVAPWCIENGYKLEGLKRVLVAGAPISVDLIRDCHAVLPVNGDADIYIPYGATEALPVTAIDGRDVVPSLLEETLGGHGTCVGRPTPGTDLRLIGITDERIVDWSDKLEVAPGELGEVVVRGPLVTGEYAQEPEHTAAAKIQDKGGTFWHRMGDIGRMDEAGRLWFQGRKSHRLLTRSGIRMPVPTENIFNTHPRVARTALVGMGAPGEELPVLVVEPVPGEMPRGEAMTEGFSMQLREIGKRHAASADVETFLFRAALPVDVRHNAKIHREELKVWARQTLA
jgi:acyl-CoA synthetase (AMP-forming)/AMP-acid ligase II